MVIDAHQHVWDPRRAPYEWLTADLHPIDRPILFDEVLPELRRLEIEATVIVQSADNDADTELMIEASAAHPEIVAMVAFAPLDDPFRLADRVAELRQTSLLSGVRNLIHRIADPEWLISADVERGLTVLEELDVSLDIVGVLPRHLELVSVVATRHPGLRIVIDHLGNPPVEPGPAAQWRELLTQAATHPNVFAKLSGLYAPVLDGGPDTLAPVIDHAIEVFGCDRLMYGGDWPISLLHGGYGANWQRIRALLDHLDAADLAQVLGGTATRFYRIDGDRLLRARTPQREGIA